MTMSSLAHRLTPRPIAIAGPLRTRAEACVNLRLLPSGDGWSLVTPEGSVVLDSLGPQGRRRCHEFARANGVLTLFS